jgi:hypothetical protein
MDFIQKPENLIYSVIEFRNGQWIETARTAYSWQAKDMALDIFTRRKAQNDGGAVRAINRNYYGNNSESTGMGILADYDIIN